MPMLDQIVVVMGLLCVNGFEYPANYLRGINQLVMEPTGLRFANLLATTNVLHPWARQPHTRARD